MKEKLSPLTKEIVKEELSGLIPVFLKLRSQIQEGRGILGKIHLEMEGYKDEGVDLSADDVLRQYRSKLMVDKENEVNSYFAGDEETCDLVIKALTDPIKLAILRGFYGITEETEWDEASNNIVNRQSYKDEGFPSIPLVNEIMFTKS